MEGKGNGSRQGEVREGKGSVNEKEKREREWIIGEEFEREESRVRNGREGEGTRGRQQVAVVPIHVGHPQC